MTAVRYTAKGVIISRERKKKASQASTCRCCHRDKEGMPILNREQGHVSLGLAVMDRGNIFKRTTLAGWVGHWQVQILS